MTLAIIYEEQWISHEEWGAVRIFADDDQDVYYCQFGGYSVMVSTDDEWSEPEPISFEQAYEIMNEWIEIAAENEEYWAMSEEYYVMWRRLEKAND